MASPDTIRVKVRDTTNVIFDGEVDRVSSFNEIGPFDVFPMHANFISIIHKELTLYNKNQKVKDLKIEQAVMKVKKDEIHIFLGLETLQLDETEASSQGKASPKK